MRRRGRDGGRGGVAVEQDDRDRAVGHGLGPHLDPGRNRHRPAEGWGAPTVATSLENPRYTGRQVWNRMANDRDEVDLRTGLPGQFPNLPEEWAISLDIAHAPLVGMRKFTEVQKVRARRPNGDGGERRYLLAGLVVCGVCGRRMDSHWVHGRPGYRCRHGYTSARLRMPGAPALLYWREDRLLERIAVLADELGQPLSSTGDGAAALLAAAGIGVVCSRQGAELRERTDRACPGAGLRRRSGGRLRLPS
ncbi:recombinase zinc beta ribbon domain-containing protein [Actinosynnema sp. NPDC023794]